MIGQELRSGSSWLFRIRSETPNVSIFQATAALDAPFIAHKKVAQYGFRTVEDGSLQREVRGYTERVLSRCDRRLSNDSVGEIGLQQTQWCGAERLFGASAHQRRTGRSINHGGGWSTFGVVGGVPGQDSGREHRLAETCGSTATPLLGKALVMLSLIHI